MRVFKVTKTIQYDWHVAGRHCFLYSEPNLLQQVTQREGVALKIFFTPVNSIEEVSTYNWGYPFDVIEGLEVRRERSNLLEAVKIQNLCSYHGFAPRVYEVLLLEYAGKLYPAMLVGNVINNNEEFNEFERLGFVEKLKQIGNLYGFSFKFADAGQANNFINKQLVDFQGAAFSSQYVNWLKRRYLDTSKWAGNVYQGIPELGIKAFRDDHRLEMLSGIEFTGKNVWDIGCSGGAFCRYAASNGANRVLGIDYPEIINTAFEVGNYLGYFNIDYWGTYLPFNTDIVVPVNVNFEPDIILFLSMAAHVGLPPVIKKVNTLIYEHNGTIPYNKVIEELTPHFATVKDIGVSGWDGRHLFILQK